MKNKLKQKEHIIKMLEKLCKKHDNFDIEFNVTTRTKKEQGLGWISDIDELDNIIPHFKELYKTFYPNIEIVFFVNKKCIWQYFVK